MWDPRQEKISCSWLNPTSPRKIQPLPITNSCVKGQSSPEEHFKPNSPGAEGLFASPLLTSGRAAAELWSLRANTNIHQWVGGQIVVGQSCRVRQVLGQEAQQRHGHGLRMDTKQRDTVRPGTSSHASSGKKRKDSHSLILMWALRPGTSAMARTMPCPALESHLTLPSHSRGPHCREQPKPQVEAQSPPAWGCHSFPPKPPFPWQL